MTVYLTKRIEQPVAEEGPAGSSSQIDGEKLALHPS